MSANAEQNRLVRQLADRGIADRRVLQAIAEVPRERFVPDEYLEQAFDDRALPIDEGQTISQPYMVALMTQELGLVGTERILEIGTGSGYQAAILSKLCRQVVTVERIASLSARACELLRALGIANVEFHVGDGSCGWPEAAPYDGIIVTAGAPEIPRMMYDQLAPGGRLVIPVGRVRPQILKTITRQPDGPHISDICECSFVPLLGEGGWPSDAE